MKKHLRQLSKGVGVKYGWSKEKGEERIVEKDKIMDEKVENQGLCEESRRRYELEGGDGRSPGL
jgi:hypothetical protein